MTPTRTQRGRAVWPLAFSIGEPMVFIVAVVFAAAVWGVLDVIIGPIPAAIVMGSLIALPIVILMVAAIIDILRLMRRVVLWACR